MVTFLIDLYDTVGGAGPTAFMVFFPYVWVLWAAKYLAAKRYRSWHGAAPALTQAGPFLTKPPDCFVEVPCNAGDEAQIAQRIDGMDRRADTVEALDGIAQQEAGTRFVPLHPGDQAKMKTGEGDVVYVPKFTFHAPRWYGPDAGNSGN